MKNKFNLFLIIVIFIFIFVIFYKSLQDTNIYTPSVKINNEIPSFSATLLYSDEKLNSLEIFELSVSESPSMLIWLIEEE